MLRANGPDGTLRIRDVARVELGAASYDAFTNARRQAGDRHRRLPAIGRQRARRSPMRCARGMRGCRQSFPQGVTQIIPFDTTRFVRVVDPRSDHHAARGRRARAAGRVRLPAELARDADPDHRRAGVADRRVRRPAAVRLHDQHADAVRDRARDRHRRRRRDRRAGERRAADGRTQAVAEGGRRSSRCAK